MADKIKVFVADPISEEGLKPLRENSRYEVVVKLKLSPQDLVKEMNGTQCLLVRSETKVTEEIIKAAKSLKLVGRAGVGVDNINVPAASKSGIVVMNVPGGNTISAAEHTMALILASARNIPQANASLKEKKWERSKFIGQELLGKTLGLIGLGRIGREVASRAKAFGMRVAAYDPFISEEQAQIVGAQVLPLDEVLKAADFVSLHTSLNDQTKKLVGKDFLSKMKPSARLVNCARGDLIDEAALAEALSSGKLKGAALDVFSQEPPAADNPLVGLPNVIVTPHLGASTEEAQVKVGYELSLAVMDYFDKGVARNAVNIPSVEPEILAQLSPYLTLGEKMGRFLGQYAEGGFREVVIRFAGDFKSQSRSLITLAVLKGLLSPVMEEGELNWVSAPIAAKERGIKVTETATQESEGFTNLITLSVKTDKEQRRVSGSVLSQNNPRIVRIDDLSLDLIPEGRMLVYRNLDRPGVIGFVGTLLGQNNVNIASIQVGRKSEGAEAISIVNVDSPIAPSVLEKIRSSSGITAVKAIDLL